MAKPDGGPAFPCVFKIGQGENGLDCKPTITPQQHIVLGMSLRDYFAAKALAGMVANHELIQRQIDANGSDQVEANLARLAYKTADETLTARDCE